MKTLHPHLEANEFADAPQGPFQELVPEIPTLVPQLGWYNQTNFEYIECNVKKPPKKSNRRNHIFLIVTHFRPTIAEAVREACPGRKVHIWQMQDPNEEGEEWLTLPILMQQHADKNYAQYQGQTFEARKRREAGELSEQKYNAIVSNSIRPLVLMNGTGAPALPKYVKDHLIKAADGTMKLKDWCCKQNTKHIK